MKDLLATCQLLCIDASIFTEGGKLLYRILTNRYSSLDEAKEAVLEHVLLSFNLFDTIAAGSGLKQTILLKKGDVHLESGDYVRVTPYATWDHLVEGVKHTFGGDG